MKSISIIIFIFLNLIINLRGYSQINSYPYVQTGEFPFGWNVIQSTPIWNFATAIVNPAGKTNDAAIICNFFAYESGPDGLVTSPLFNFTSLNNPIVHFYTAHTSYDLENDSMQFLISTDGGSTFNNVPVPFRRSFNSVPSLATAPTQHTQYNPLSVNQWRHETVNLAAYAGQNNIMLGFRGVCDYGNNFWLDNFIVNDANNYCRSVITAPGSFNCSNIRVDLNTIGNPGGGELSVSEHSLQTSVPTLASPNIAVNTTAVTNDGSVFTPNKISPYAWYSVSYTGNDINGYANYNISIDYSGYTGIDDPDKLYIVKRADMTGSWVCLNTTISGTTLVSNGLTTFSDFGIASDSMQNLLPVELSSFTYEVSGRDVNLNWSTTSEMNNSGFEIEKSDFENNTSNNWRKIGFVEGGGTSATLRNYSFNDRGLNSGKYNYRLKQIDLNGNFEYFTLNIEVIVGAPSEYGLSQNYPNPFNPVTKISYSIPFPGKVSIKVFDISGKEIIKLISLYHSAGFYTINFDASELSSGIYFYRISAGSEGNYFTDTKRMMLVR